MATGWGEAVHQQNGAGRSRRVSVDLESSMVIQGEQVKVTVLDISRSGVRLRLREPVFVGEVHELELGRSGFVEIQICWCRGFEAGAIFLDLE